MYRVDSQKRIKNAYELKILFKGIFFKKLNHFCFLNISFFCKYDNFDIFVHHHNNAQKSMLKKYFSYFINRFRIVWTCSTRLEQIFFCLHDYVMSLTLENLIVKNKSTRFKFICWSSSHFLLIIVCFFSFSTKHFKEKENDHRFSQA